MTPQLRQFDEITFTLKSGEKLTCFLEKEPARKLAEKWFDMMQQPTRVKAGAVEADTPSCIRIDGWINTPLILSVIHLVDLTEVAGISIVDAPKITFNAVADPPDTLAEEPAKSKGAE